MKFWALEYHNDNSPSGSVREFFGTKRKASTRARALDRETPGGKESYFRAEPESVDVPTSRVELLDWLNRNATIA